MLTSTKFLDSLQFTHAMRTKRQKSVERRIKKGITSKSFR